MTEEEFLYCKDILEGFVPSIGNDLWQTVYCLDTGPYWREGSTFTVWSALVTREEANKILANTNDFSFDLGFQSTGLSVSQYVSKKGKGKIAYEPSHSKSIKPLALPGHIEGLCEEFRLFHDCKINETHNGLVVENDSYEQIEIARIEENQIQVHKKYLFDFLGISQLHLVIFLDVVRLSKDSSVSHINEKMSKDGNTNGFRWRRHVAPWPPGKVKNIDQWGGFLKGKKIFSPISIKEAYANRYEPSVEYKKRDEVKFIIGIDDNGENIEFGCNPKLLSDRMSGNNLGNPDYMTEVHFSKDVLEKYYNNPEVYKVDGGSVRHLSQWILRADTDHADRVIVYLGDLHELPHKELLRWCGHNIKPEGGISASRFKNDFEVIPTEADVADLKFRRTYENFNATWSNVHGYPLFTIQTSPDRILLNSLQIPSGNSQKVFDEQILTLTKLLVDAINQKEINIRIDAPNEVKGGIKKLENLLSSMNYSSADETSGFLKDLQNLRSSGAAHMKGKGYQKVVNRLNIDLKKKPEAFEKILNEAISHLEKMQNELCG